MTQPTSTSIEDLIRQSQDSANTGEDSDNTSGTLQKKIVQIDIKEHERLTKQKADELKLNYISLRGYPIGPDTISIISEESANTNKAIVFYISNERVRVGIVDPSLNTTANLLEELNERFKGGVDLYLISDDSFQYALKNYARVVKHKVVSSGLEISQADIVRYQAEIVDFEVLDKKVKTASITDVFTMILAAGINTGASDVHIEANENDIQVRFRIDGVLFEVATLPKESWVKVINRIKLMAKLKMNVNTIPQDGRITVTMDKDKIDIRVSTLPTAYGESVVMRLLRSSATALAFDELGIRGLAYEQLKQEIKRPNGMIITTGPTGSGKTTTLYAILNHLNDPESKIITLEDPIEYKLAGISQSQIDSARDYTFAKGLRAILRQDPDIVMVGEIRDSETTEIAIQAALTGHLVLSTVHTNSAAGTIPRFIALNAKPFLLAPALNAVMAQRLIRRICANCKTEYHPSENEMVKVRQELEAIPVSSGYKVDINNLKFYHGSGCDKCQHLGLKGRVGIYEVMVMSPDVEKIILSGQVSEYVIQEAAVKNGMITMVQDGILKALDGLTTLEEVFRVAE
ncbi:MAG: GspE/PulE family protein [Patescibacteria group bacterium]|jgi:type IV pilus assembly protein PilB